MRRFRRFRRSRCRWRRPSGRRRIPFWGIFIEDRNTLAPPDAASAQLLREQVQEVLNSLTERESRVLKLRFGLEDGRTRTLEEVGREFGVTRERIRQIEAKAIRKLRHPSPLQEAAGLFGIEGRRHQRRLCPLGAIVRRRGRRIWVCAWPLRRTLGACGQVPMVRNAAAGWRWFGAGFGGKFGS